MPLNQGYLLYGRLTKETLTLSRRAHLPTHQGSPSQVQYTLVPLVFRALGLARTIRAAEATEEEQAAAAAAAATEKAAGEKKSVAAKKAAAAAAAEAAAATSAGEEATEGNGKEGGGGGRSSGDAANGDGGNGKAVAAGESGEGGEGDETPGTAATEQSEDDGEAAATETTALEDGEQQEQQEEEEEEEEEGFPPPPPPVTARPRQFSSRKVYQFLHEIVTAMAPLHPWVSLSLFLQCALGADHTGFKAIAYEFFSQVRQDDVELERFLLYTVGRFSLSSAVAGFSVEAKITISASQC